MKWNPLQHKLPLLATTICLLFAFSAHAQTPPVAVDDTIGMCEGTAATINVIANDIDPDAGETLEINVLIGPADPLIGYDEDDSTITVYVDPAFTGTDVIVYQVCGNDDMCDIGLLYIIVSGDAGCVWPGDANADSICNYVDLLPIGVFYGNNGPDRYDEDGSWEGSYCGDWSDDDLYTISPNPKYADCNGDGFVDGLDTVVIINNYGQTRGTYSPEAFIGGAGDPLFGVEFFSDTIAAGSEVVIPLILGTEAIPASNIYGLAFELDYDQTTIVPGSVHVTFNSGWLGTPGTDLMSLQVNDTTAGIVSVAVTRLNQISRSGFGNVGEVSFVMEDNIAGKTNGEITSTVNFCVNYPQMRNNYGNPLNMNPVCDSVVVFQMQSGVDDYLADHISIYPNPSDKNVHVSLPSGFDGTCELFNIFGLSMYSVNVHNADQIIIPTAQIPAGTYAISLRNDQANFTHQLIIQH